MREMARPIPDQSAWQAWHPHELAQRLQGLSQPWCVVGGWALDLWHGHVTRSHEDLEFTVLRRDLPVFCRRMRELGLALYAAHSGVLTLLAPGEQGGPGELPADGIAQIWCWDAAAACWRVDMMVEAGTLSTWVYKRTPAPSRTPVVARATGAPAPRPCLAAGAVSGRACQQA